MATLARHTAALPLRLSALLAPPAKAAAEAAPAYVPLPSEQPQWSSFAQPEFRQPLQKVDKSFKLHVGGVISLPCLTKQRKAEGEGLPPPAAAAAQRLHDPFEGLPFRSLADRLGEAVLPAVQEARAAQRQGSREAREAAAASAAEAPHVPHLLPFTRWAATSAAVRATLVAEEPASRKKARLSWYHPDDSMVPRDWFKGGLLADLAYYKPFASPN